MTTFTVTNEREAAWVLARYSRSIQQTEAVAARAKDLVDRAKNYREAHSQGPRHEADYWGSLLDAYHRNRLLSACSAAGVDFDDPDEKGWAKITAKTEVYPCGALRARRSKPAFYIYDEAAYIAWATESLLEGLTAVHGAIGDLAPALPANVVVALRIEATAPEFSDRTYSPGLRPEDPDTPWPVASTIDGETIPGLAYRPATVTLSITPETAYELAAYDAPPEDSPLSADLPWSDRAALATLGETSPDDGR